MTNSAFDNIKDIKKMMQEFQDKRVQVFIKDDASQGLVSALTALRKQLLDKLQEQQIQARIEIEKAEIKKINLIKRLVMLEKVKDVKAQDDIIKELEEYSRIRRYRDAQLAKINKEIQDLNLTKEQFQKKMKSNSEKNSTDALYHHI
ncbi:MAG: hypothetical protein JSS07_03385 [Proteobacteria bacterium]|nr:hypothetical protein [Pseudomonadota bacterium]